MLYLLYRSSDVESCSPDSVNVSGEVSSDFDLSTNQRIGIYSGIVGFTVLVIITRVVLCYLVVLGASRSLHSKMLKAILQAPIFFFDTNPVGESNYLAKDFLHYNEPITSRTCAKQIFKRCWIHRCTSSIQVCGISHC